jgi:ABC-type lipoprotein export system ATPase subunit
MNDPKIVFADEPTGNLDSKSGGEVTDLLIDLHREGKTVVIVTHDLELARIANRQIKMLDGKVISDTTNGKKNKRNSKK